MTKSPLRRNFFVQLNDKAAREGCFIHNPSKVISEGTNRLERGEPMLSHTGWGLNEKEIWLDFYCVDASKVEMHARENKENFHALYAWKSEIEKDFGEVIIWDYNEFRIKQSIISRTPVQATEDNQDNWSVIQDDLVQRAIRLRKVFECYFRKVVCGEKPNIKSPAVESPPLSGVRYLNHLANAGGDILSELQEEYTIPARVECVTNRIVRDTPLAIKVKQMHNSTCQICGCRIILPNGNGYAEAHHIKPLSEDGPDVPENIICVCPNHHVELDYRVSKIKQDNIETVSGHSISPQFIDYHNSRVK